MLHVRVVPRDRLRAAEVSWVIFGLALIGTGVLKSYCPGFASLVLPVCVLRRLTGIRCPTCGSGTALSLLIQGRLGAALDSNWLAVALTAGLVGFWLFLLGTFVVQRRLSVTVTPRGNQLMLGIGLVALALAWLFQGR
jgi:hypothetical protein